MIFWQKISKSLKNIPAWTIGLTIGIAFLAVGFYEEHLADIYKKAVVICLECIGIG